MPKGESGLFVSYCAKDFLDGTQLLGPWEELAYRRICDMIYATNDRLQDDDRMLAWATKTGRRWPAIKVALTTGDRPKLMIVDGRITNKRCQSALGTAAQKIAQKRGAGEASAAAGKSLKNLKQNRTDDREPVREHDRTEHRTYPLNHQPEEKITLTGDPKEPAVEPVEAELVEPAVEPPAKPKRGSRKREVPEDFWPCQKGIAFAFEHAGWAGIKLSDEVDHFIGHHRLHENKYVNHELAWENWVRNGKKFGARFTNGRRSAHADETAAFDAITRTIQ